MSTAFERLVEVMQRLRGEGGCPWDRQQTRESLTPFLLEETHEVLEAIEAGRPDALREELGDLLFQVLFHAQIASEASEFDIDDVVEGTVRKMTRRHPHVFGTQKSAMAGGVGASEDARSIPHGPPQMNQPGGEEPLPPTAMTADQVLARWEMMKRQEAGHRARASVVDGVPRSLPALLRAHQVQAKAARVGFDWPERGPVQAKVEEEWGELTEAVGTQSQRRQEEELGDLLFAVVNLARHLRCDPEAALQRATQRFIDRFHRMEQLAAGAGRPLVPAGANAGWTLTELEGLWEQAKSEEGKETKAD
ncbi:MAG: nucleoside triphosphate pyrophosphohydrolase [Nitrospirae bacterium]|nr:nucleoside triphosphate pyrophosphohydrolase [Nitrospirota bacterium]